MEKGNYNDIGTPLDFARKKTSKTRRYRNVYTLSENRRCKNVKFWSEQQRRKLDVVETL